MHSSHIPPITAGNTSNGYLKIMGLLEGKITIKMITGIERKIPRLKDIFSLFPVIFFANRRETISAIETTNAPKYNDLSKEYAYNSQGIANRGNIIPENKYSILIRTL